jgi:hypothetical protein
MKAATTTMTAHPRTVINASNVTVAAATPTTTSSSTTVLTYANQVPVQCVSAPQNPSFAEAMVKSTVIPPTTSAQIPSATENQLPTQEQIPHRRDLVASNQKEFTLDI